MPFPELTEIYTALQNPQVSFKHKGLSEGVLTDSTNPIRDSGRYAAVSQIKIQNRNFALRIPIAEWEDSKPRYQMIKRVVFNKCSAFVECELLADAIQIPVPAGPLQDVLVMEWVDGTNLSTFVKDSAERGAVHELEQLRESLKQTCSELQGLQISHGDLSPLNVLVVRSLETNRVAVKLVDYDFVAHPSLGFVTRLPHSPTRHPSRPSISDSTTDLFVFHLYDTVLEALIMQPAIIRQLDDYLDQTLYISLSDRTSESDQNIEILRSINSDGISRLEALAAAPYLDTPLCAGVVLDLPADTIPSSDWSSLDRNKDQRVWVFGYVRKQEGELAVLEMPTPNNRFQGVVVSPRRGHQKTAIVVGKPLIAAGIVRQRDGQIIIDEADIADPNDEAIQEKIPKGWMRGHIETLRKRTRDKIRRQAHDEGKTPPSGRQILARKVKSIEKIESSMSPHFPRFDGSARQRLYFTNPPPMGIDVTKHYSATIHTSDGKIKVALDALAAPRTVNNFVFLALHHFYDGLIFHRVVAGQAIFTGDPTGVGAGGPGYTFDDGRASGVPYEIGSVAMVNTGRSTLGSQFFIVSGPKGCGIPPVYTQFGRVTRGIRTVERIQTVPTGRVIDARTYRPITDIVVESVTISVDD